MRLFLALMLISSMAMATQPHGNHHGNPNSNSSAASATGGDSQSGSESNSSANSGDSSATARVGDSILNAGGATTGQSRSVSGSYSEASDSSSSVDATNTATNTVRGGTTQTDIEITREYEAVAQAVHSLNLTYCNSGGSVSDKNASFNIGGRSFTCESSMAMGIVLTTANNSGAEHMAIALQRARDIEREVYEHIMFRSNTANYGAAFLDLWWVVAIFLVTGVPAL